jgi:hypothetical protein
MNRYEHSQSAHQRHFIIELDAKRNTPVDIKVCRGSMGGCEADLRSIVEGYPSFRSDAVVLAHEKGSLEMVDIPK